MKYEMLYLIDPAMTDEQRDACITKFEKTVQDLKGTVLSVDKWGHKKLAYPINYKTEAFYVLMTFEAEGSILKELDRIVGLTECVLRRMITKAV